MCSLLVYTALTFAEVLKNKFIHGHYDQLGHGVIILLDCMVMIRFRYNLICKSVFDFVLHVPVPHISYWKHGSFHCFHAESYGFRKQNMKMYVYQVNFNPLSSFQCF